MSYFLASSVGSGSSEAEMDKTVGGIGVDVQKAIALVDIWCLSTVYKAVDAHEDIVDYVIEQFQEPQWAAVLNHNPTSAHLISIVRIHILTITIPPSKADRSAAHVGRERVRAGLAPSWLLSHSPRLHQWDGIRSQHFGRRDATHGRVETECSLIENRLSGYGEQQSRF